ncbi:MAG: energy transducer TonB [Thermodesulfovibrionales bacterium]|nr:energy transducer TonB [Thermodesulfovibrionales bacterium]
MNRQFKAMSLSFAVHASVMLGIIGLSGSVVPSGTMVIDFSLEDSRPPAKNQGNTAMQKPPQPEIQQKKEKPPEIAPSLSETQTPVEATEEKGRPHEEARLESAATNSASPISGYGPDGASAGYSRSSYLKENFSYIRDTIQKKITYPAIARQMGLEGSVVVSFIVRSDGSAKDITIKESSGIEILDRSAVEAVKKASPFPMPLLEAQLIIPIKYKLRH